jgi:hypothetical protein
MLQSNDVGISLVVPVIEALGQEANWKPGPQISIIT